MCYDPTMVIVSMTMAHSNQSEFYVKKNPLNFGFTISIFHKTTHILYQCAKFGNDRTSFNVKMGKLKKKLQQKLFWYF